MSDLVLFEMVADWIALVTLNRPDKRNAISPELARALADTVDRTEADDAVRVVILNSSNDDVFCAGADLKAVSEGRGGELYVGKGGFAGFVEYDRKKPWIAAVAGSVLAGGMELALACDMIVASETSQFGLPEAKRGLMAGAGGVTRLARKVPNNVAVELVVTGEPVGVKRAFEIGLVNKVVPGGQQLHGAIEIARSIARNAPLAVQEGLAMVRQGDLLDDAEGFRKSNEAIARLRESEDYLEGPRAFVEKRPPVWKGR